MSDYQRIADAIAFIIEQADSQPTLDDVANHLHVSPYHFQRLFSRWAGVTPKRFLQVLTVERAKHLLAQAKPLLEVSDSVGLSSSSRLYDHFVHLEAVTPGEYKSRGKGLCIEYGYHSTPFGDVFVAQTARGICRISFVDQPLCNSPLEQLEKEWPFAELRKSSRSTANVVATIFSQTDRLERPLSLHVSGTNFQINVWKALLRLPPANVSSYRNIAEHIGCPNAARAVGQAVGANPVAFIIPCHRVIQQSGRLGGYRWGKQRKHAMHAWESARAE